MKRLNLRTPKPYDLSDQADTIEERKHFFCVSEGATEESYFSGVRNNREKLDIKGNVFILTNFSPILIWQSGRQCNFRRNRKKLLKNWERQ